MHKYILPYFEIYLLLERANASYDIHIASHIRLMCHLIPSIDKI